MTSNEVGVLLPVLLVLLLEHFKESSPQQALALARNAMEQAVPHAADG